MKFYKLTYANGSTTFVQAKNLTTLVAAAKRQTPTKNIKTVHRINATGDGYIKVKNPFK